MTANRKYFLICLFAGNCLLAQSQGVSISDTTRIPGNYKPKLERQIRHDAIDREQEQILASDGKADRSFTPSTSDEVNFLLTKALLRRSDVLQYLIETDPKFDHRLKVNYLYGLENILKYFRTHWKLKTDKKVNPVSLPLILTAYEETIALDRNGLTIEAVIDALPYDAATNLSQANIFDKNPGLKTVKQSLIRKYIAAYPHRTFLTLQQNPDVPFADSMVRVMARRYPRQLYDFAAANSKLGNIIRNIKDDVFIETVAKMARSRSGQQYFPFVDNIVNGKMTLEEIDAVKDDSVAYYKLLVRTQMDYVKRAINKDTALEFSGLTARLERKAREDFVNTINALHDYNAEFRFRTIQPLNAYELYYLAVSSDGSIYTSSFVKGIYPLMMKKIGNRGDSLLMNLHFDKYRKFIKMSAGFNTLSEFLASFPPKKSPTDESDAEKLMKAFVSKLESGNGLEDGVDVADSYASISETLKPIAAEMLRNIDNNYHRVIASNNKRGIEIYRILRTLFMSADSSRHIDLTKELGIPPVYGLPFTDLRYDSTHVAVQLFIYGDRDGRGVFPGLISMFNNSNWKIDQSNKQWVTVTAAKGQPVSLYMNRPLPEETNEDAKAQEALCEYLRANKIVPTVTINRGHSYNAPYTIDQMSTASKIVFMGSCGGYRMIHDILEKAPDAHIIGTKQIADAPVNNPFLKLIMEKLRLGSNIDWIPFWKELDSMVTDKIFEDYVPPHKNLGALFIKAYRIAMGETEVEE